jgi:hypothetical protein
MKNYLAAAAVILIASTAHAQKIRWKPIGENAPAPFESFKPFAPMDTRPLSPPATTYNQIGPLTFGSDGSRGYTTGDRTITRMPNGEIIPDAVYLRGLDGRLVKCKKYGENVFCD